VLGERKNMISIGLDQFKFKQVVDDKLSWFFLKSRLDKGKFSCGKMDFISLFLKTTKWKHNMPLSQHDANIAVWCHGALIRVKLCFNYDVWNIKLEITLFYSRKVFLKSN
jgi:hypothetical protein